MSHTSLSPTLPPGSTVLIARFSAIGDVAMTIPVVYSACRCYPGLRFVMLTRPSMTSIFADAPANLEVVGADVKGPYSGLGGLRRLAAEMRRRYSPAVFIDLHDVLRTRIIGLFMRLHGIPVVHYDKGRRARRALTRIRNKVVLPLRGIREAYADAFAAAGLPLTDCFCGLYSGPCTAPADAYAAITPPKLPGERWIGIAPFAAHAGKIYPPELMEQVVDTLAANRSLRIFLLGGGGKEADTMLPWAERHANVDCLAGRRYGFAAELALFNHLDCMLSMDSGNMHLAAIAGAPTVSIWGATHPFCGFTAWHQTDADTVQLSLECRPCSVFGNKPCRRGDMLCLRAIKPATVAAHVLKTLDNGRQL